MTTRWMIPLAAAAVMAVAVDALAQPQATTPMPVPPAPNMAVMPAQEPPAAVAPQVPRATTPPAAPQAPQPPRARGQLVNLRLEFTITDQVGTAPPTKKSIVMNVADGEFGRIRTNNEGQWKSQWRTVPFSIDASPEIEGNRIRLRISLEFQSLDEVAEAGDRGGFSKLQQSITCIVADGVPMSLTVSADPVTDRKVTLDVKASVVK